MPNSSKSPYSRFEAFCLRTPLYSIDLFLELTSSKEIDDSILISHFSDPIINEAIYLASPQLHVRLERWSNGDIHDLKKYNRIRKTFIKYLIRLSTRCTPFGLFAGCSIGSFSKKTMINLDSRTNHRRYTRLDMHYLVRLANSLEDHPDLCSILNYKKNTSLYKVGNRFRYVEIELKESKRLFTLESFFATDEVKYVLDTANTGKTKSELIKALIRYGSTRDEAIEFVDGLINNQILVSDLEPNVTGPAFSDFILERLKRVKSLQGYLNYLRSILDKVESLDGKLGNNVESYYALQEMVKKLKVPFNPKFLVQTDLFPRMIKNEISHSITRKIKRGIWVLKKISQNSEPQSIANFKERFFRRFENQRVSLLFALDVETGVGYIKNPKSIEPDHLFQEIDLVMPYLETPKKSIDLSQFQSYIIPKILNAIRKFEKQIRIEKSDIEKFERQWEGSPNTISITAQIIKDGDNEKVFLSSCSSNGGRLLARFSGVDHETKKLIEDIVKKEIELSKNQVLAEIIHLPEDRTGNILRRPHLYDYELPYLGRSTYDHLNIVALEDLEIYLDQEEIILFSKKIQSQIIPRLTNAHNYRNSTNPVYQFLCDLQFQNKRGFGFVWGDLKEIFDFLPQLEYEDVIISKAQWKIDIEHIKDKFGKDITKIDELYTVLKDRGIPEYFSTIYGDNRLCLNINNKDCLEILLDFVKKYKQIWLEEAFMDRDNQVVIGIDGMYVNEVIMPFYKEQTN